MRNRKSVFALICTFLLAAGLFSGCMKEEFGGIGIEVPAGTEQVSKSNPFLILSVFKGGTGESAGLKENDRIEKVDGVSIYGLRQDYIVKNLLRGKVGSLVTIEIVRSVGGSPTGMVFRIPRGNILIQK